MDAETSLQGSLSWSASLPRPPRKGAWRVLHPCIDLSARMQSIVCKGAGRGDYGLNVPLLTKNSGFGLDQRERCIKIDSLWEPAILQGQFAGLPMVPERIAKIAQPFMAGNNAT